MSKISVIIPVYNTSQYLKKCLNSVVNQTLKDIEIICVNDCSTDNSLEILQEYAKNDKRIKVINFDKNQGVPKARNTGIEQARGEYISFIDSDDWVDENFYEVLYSCAIKNECDIVKGQLCYVSVENGDQRPSGRNEGIKEDINNFYLEFTTAIYKLDFIKGNHLGFPEDTSNYEDIVFSLGVIFNKPKIKIIDDVNYYYLQYPQSSKRNLSYDRIMMFIKSTEYIVDLLNKFIDDKDYYLHLFNKIVFCPFMKVYEKAELTDNEADNAIKCFETTIIKKIRYSEDVNFTNAKESCLKIYKRLQIQGIFDTLRKK